MTDIASLGIRVQTTGVEEADKKLAGLSTTAKGAEGAARGVEKSWQQLSFNPQKLFSANQALNDYKRKLQEAATAAAQAGAKTSTTFNSAIRSTKEMSAALRQVPMQFTDIATSLASGQRPLQVLLQQGGQLKDLFGGVGPAVRALGGYVAGLINPLTLAAAAVAALGFAWKAAIDEAQAFNLALIKTGHYSADSAKDLEALAETLDDTTDATQRFASNVVTQIAATGRVSAENMRVVSEAVTNMAKATQAAGGDADEAIKSLTKSFTDLARDPVEALLKLNETQHFLTQATLEQVRSLVEQGREAEAAKVAIRAFADETNRGAKEIEQSINSASAVWSGFKNVIGESTDEVINFFRNADAGLQAFILRHEAAARALVKLQSMVTPVLPFGQLQQSASQSLLDSAKASQFSGVKGSVRGGGLEVVNSDESRKKIKEMEDAQRGWNSAIRQGETDTQRLNRELKELEKNGLLLKQKPEDIKAAQDALRAAFERRGPKGRKPPKENTRGIENASDRFDDMVGSLRVELSGPMERVEQQHIKRMRELEQAARDGQRSHEDLTAALKLEGEAYRNAANDVQFRIDAEVAGLSGPIAQAQQAHEATLRRIEELKQQGLVTGTQYAEMLRQEASAYEADMQAAERAADPIGALLSDMQAELDLIGKSNAERDIMIALRQANVDAMSAEGQAAIQTAKAFEDEAKAKQRSIELMDEFRSGASNALADIVTGAKSAKEAFADFFDDLARRITQMIAEQWIEKAFGAMGTSNTGSAGGGWLSAIASLFAGGRATGGPVQANRLYEVGEHNKPELLQMHGRSYLIPGNKGNVTPITGNQQRPSVTNVTTFYVPDLSSRRNQQQVADRTQRLQSRATARN